MMGVIADKLLRARIQSVRTFRAYLLTFAHPISTWLAHRASQCFICARARPHTRLYPRPCLHTEGVVVVPAELPGHVVRSIRASWIGASRWDSSSQEAFLASMEYHNCVSSQHLAKDLQSSRPNQRLPLIQVGKAECHERPVGVAANLYFVNPCILPIGLNESHPGFKPYHISPT